MAFDRSKLEALRARARKAAAQARAAAGEVGERAYKAAMARPEIRARVETARKTIDAVRGDVEARLEEIESDLWAWVQRLQAEAQRQSRQAERRLNAEDHYRTLGLKPGVGMAEVKRAWREKMREHHPDRFAHDPKAEARAHEEALRINQAYEALTALLTGRENRARR